MSEKLTFNEVLRDCPTINSHKRCITSIALLVNSPRDHLFSCAGLTEDQLFFVAAGQVWCAEATKEAERLQVQTDPHSPSKFRVMGPMVNHPGFAGAFSCAPGTPMNPPAKCEVW